MIKVDSVDIGILPDGKKHFAVSFEGTPIHSEVMTKCILELLRRFDPDGYDSVREKMAEAIQDRGDAVFAASQIESWDVCNYNDVVKLELDDRIYQLNHEDAKNISVELDRNSYCVKRRMAEYA